jgi:hypothetical protein
VDISPQSLSEEYKQTYRLRIAEAYQANGDLTRAVQRLMLLGDPNSPAALAAQAQTLLSAGAEGPGGEAEESARALADLAAALSAPPGAAAQPSPGVPAGTDAAAVGENTRAPVETAPLTTLDLTQSVQTATLQPSVTPTAGPTGTPRPSFTPRASPSPFPTLGAPFALVSQEEVCDPDLAPGLLQVQLNDADGDPAPGVRISLAWDGGLESFFTGLHPEINPGYADFGMQAGVEYSLRIEDIGETIDGLSAPECEGESGAYLGGLSLEFQQP